MIGSSAAAHEHFFDNLPDSSWLPFLATEGFFSKPPEPERGESGEGEWVRFPIWPESRYLLRCAAEDPKRVAELAAAIPDSQNVRVHEDLLAIATDLPGPLAARLARTEGTWLGRYDGPLMSLPGSVGPLMAHLAQEGEFLAALTIGGSLLRIEPAEGFDENTARKRARSRISDWYYGKIIDEAWPAMIEADPKRSFSFLCHRLADVVRIGFIDGGFDSTYVWRSAVEDHGQNLGHSLFDTLVEAVRDNAVAIAQTEDRVDLVLGELAARDLPICTRIALHVLRELGSPEQVVEALSDSDLAEDFRCQHEYAELLRARFGELDDSERAPILGLIARGRERELSESQIERGLTREDLEKRDRYWRLERYSLISEHLRGDQRRGYLQLVEELGEPEHPNFHTVTTSWTGPTSPKNADELAAMGPQGLAEYLVTWEAEGGDEAPSPEGLGRVLDSVIAEDAPRFAAAADLFEGLEPTYVRAYLGGLAAAAKEGIDFRWLGVLALCRWVVDQPRSDLDSSTERDRDFHWGWARKEVANLIGQGLRETSGGPTPAEREQVWSLLELLAEDPEPAFAKRRSGDGDYDPATEAINTVRGEAMHAVFRYALWVERSLESEFHGLSSVPEVRLLLERHLDLEVDPALAIRAVYGQWLPQLIRMDPGWAKENRALILPSRAGLEDYFDSAWQSYVLFNPPWTEVLELLEGSYRYAIERLNVEGGPRPFAGDPREHLGEHLLAFRLRGTVGLGEEELFVEFWGAADVELRQRVITSMAWALEQGSELLPEDFTKRLVETWDWIAASAQGPEEQTVLAAFGALFGVQSLDSEWLLGESKRVLELGVHLSPDYAFFDALPRLAAEHPLPTIQALALMVSTDPDEWSVLGAVDEVKEAVSVVLAGDDTLAREEAITLVDILLAQGMRTFRDLLSEE